jgi:hydrogenase/urease accessory protein HupE
MEEMISTIRFRVLDSLRGGLLCLASLMFWWFAVAGNADGHAMKQVRAEISINRSSWEGSVWLEAWALYPEDGTKVPPGTPGEPGTAGQQWVATLNPADHKVMRDTAVEFLKETFVLTLDRKRLEASFEFPDYASERPVLKENDAGNALVRIEMRGEIPAGSNGQVELAWLDDEDEPLAIQVKILNPEEKTLTKLLRIAPQDEPIELLRIREDGRTEESRSSSLLEWIAAGFAHILPMGLDHICFILGLFLLQPKIKPLLWQTSAFTLAHSITLALVVLGVITAPARIVEPMIALSIAYVGIENLWVKDLKPWRVALVFGLGLLHGMGFASVMQELEMPEGQVIEPLVGFNLGVELGQVTVLLLAFAATFWFIRKPAFGIVRKVASAALALVGLYWTFQRIFA